MLSKKSQGHNRLSSMKPAIIEKKLKKAHDLLAAEDFASALPRFEELTRLCPDSALIWMEYAGVASNLSKAATAELARRKARELAPRNSNLLLQLGHQYQGQHWLLREFEGGLLMHSPE